MNHHNFSIWQIYLDLLQIANLIDTSISGDVSADDVEREVVFRKLIKKINNHKENLSSSRKNENFGLIH